jgi:hypothetical protein
LEILGHANDRGTLAFQSLEIWPVWLDLTKSKTGPWEDRQRMEGEAERPAESLEKAFHV